LDIEHAIALVNTVNWAFFDARFILNINARLGNYIGHDLTSKLVSLLFDRAYSNHALALLPD
jgi:hypothetical protein